MMRRRDLGMVYLAIYIDNCYCNGNKAAINDSITGIVKNRLNVTIKDDLEDYLKLQDSFQQDENKGLARPASLD